MPTLHWIGKDKVINHHLDVPYKVLEHQYHFSESSVSEFAGLKNLQDLASAKIQSSTNPTNSNSDNNKIIHGDNLEALKSLLPEYEGKIKCIYIDPPYNTGNESWVYNDNVNDPKIKKWLGNVVGKEAEDLTRHDKWLCMMYPRLKLLHKLLADDGAIFISIDDNEQANLKLMMDEIFGGGNFINNVIWQKKFSPQNDARYFSDNHDFILCYAKSKINWKRNLLSRTEEQNDRYKNLDNDTRGNWTSSDFTVKTYSKEYDYQINTPSGKIINPTDGRSWMTSKENFQKLIDDNRIWFGKNGENVPRVKKFLSDVQQGTVPLTIWTHNEVGHNQNAKQDLKKIFFNTAIPFETPKPHSLIGRILQISTDKNSIILDSFAGSGTTAHAVLNLNKQDGGNRKFILIEMETYAETITAERVKRVINGYGNTEGTGGSFDFYTLGEPLFLEDGLLNENLPLEKIREYIWYTETQTSYKLGMMSDELGNDDDATSLITHNSSFITKNELGVMSDELESDENERSLITYNSSLITKNPFLGKNQNTAYYFYYHPQEITTLDHDFLAAIKTKAEQYIIYADNCLLTQNYMAKNSIIFKKIPRDVTKF